MGAGEIFLIAARHSSVEPGEQRRRLAKGQAERVFKSSIAGCRRGRRHALLHDFFPNRPVPVAHIAVVRQRHREAARRVAGNASPLQDADDFAIEADVARDRIVGLDRQRNERCERERQNGCRDSKHAALR
jgi:hypothetical protein